ncbi:MAG: hypothetical protein LBB22_05950 [Treponema sp.]|jgi:hypothetical protein|nr:hypothetical protein [Treponema sp.]
MRNIITAYFLGLMVFASIIFLACPVAPETVETDVNILEAWVDVLGTEGSYQQINSSGLSFQINDLNYNEFVEEPDPESGTGYKLRSANILPLPAINAGSLSYISIYKAVNSTVLGVPPSILFTGALAGGGGDLTGIMEIIVQAYDKTNPANVSSGSKTVNLNFIEAVGTVNALRLVAGSLSSNSGIIINDNLGIVDMVSTGSVGTLISGDSASGYVNTSFTDKPSVILSQSNTGKSVYPIPADYFILDDTVNFTAGSFSAGSFTLGTLSNDSSGLLYITDTGSASAEEHTTGTITVIFGSKSTVKISANSLTYTLPPFAVTLRVSRDTPAASD